uniref:Uncharacterized protein n=1 Tax=Molossus molossus TaxID=27622 RepID=A0A7J8DBJ3_MOLMO|nr:hypothetical protein HJG59_009329 [Molossus molossus]
MVTPRKWPAVFVPDLGLEFQKSLPWELSLHSPPRKPRRKGSRANVTGWQKSKSLSTSGPGQSAGCLGSSPRLITGQGASDAGPEECVHLPRHGLSVLEGQSWRKPGEGSHPREAKAKGTVLSGMVMCRSRSKEE